jgi:hypothetical protein
VCVGMCSLLVSAGWICGNVLCVGKCGWMSVWYVSVHMCSLCRYVFVVGTRELDGCVYSVCVVCECRNVFGGSTQMIIVVTMLLI